MRNENRLAKLEQHKPGIVYPSFSDMYNTQSKGDYMSWMIKNNPSLTEADIEALNVRHFSEMYE